MIVPMSARFHRKGAKQVQSPQLDKKNAEMSVSYRNMVIDESRMGVVCVSPSPDEEMR
jgi:hypothetical protein